MECAAPAALLSLSFLKKKRSWGCALHTLRDYRIFLFYVCSVLFVFTWWGYFLSFSRTPTRFNFTSVDTLEEVIIPKEILIQSLGGNSSLMAKMLAEWGSYNNHLHLSSESNKYKILPQTESAASFCFALIEPGSIVAIPHSMRKHTQLYPTETTNQIPFNLGTYSREKLYHLHPDIAFVAEYSDPHLVKNLQDLGIRTICLKNILTFSDFKIAILELGSILNCFEKAKLLATFMEKAISQMEDHLNKVRNSKKKQPKIIYLNHHGKLCTPTKKTLLGQLFASLGINEHLDTFNPNYQHHWRIPLTQEQIINYQPDCLILSTPTKEEALNILANPAFQSLPAVVNKQVYYVDEIVQESLSQHIVLAFYELYRIVLHCIQTEPS